ncbi:hypothetical protein NBT05_10005 [Aquimarina sp. ERC-38]|uniref:hypothetical protein n=1 Tax=Aquimarina sp. ERC-38 TaxID=2949996 RepID=UPI0022483CAD|nr:hypothetical protein [Aquimarina sp. ERC-38]UZO79304.1 hypothetical protein NBT05_10005 [Aquimarina sp. ERC-38]
MFESLSGEMQLILVVLVIAVLFIFVFYNSKRNKEKLYNRRSRNFKNNVLEKRKSKESNELGSK